MREITSEIEQKQMESGIAINPPVLELEILNFERKTGFKLPAAFKEFYLICNGFECTEDIFKIISLNEALQHKQDDGKKLVSFC